MTGVLTIRTANAADLAPLDALFARSYPRLLKAHYPPSVMVTAVPLIARAQPALIASGTFYVAVLDDERLVGAGGWTREGGSVRAEVRHVVTDDRLTRRGIGRALLTQVLEQARAAGATAIACKATRNAVPFYKAMGFRVRGPVIVPLRPGIDFPAVAMTRRL